MVKNVPIMYGTIVIMLKFTKNVVLKPFHIQLEFLLGLEQ